MIRDITSEIISILAKASEPGREEKIEAIFCIVNSLGLGEVLKLHLKSLGDDGTMSDLSDDKLSEVFGLARTWSALASQRPNPEFENDGVIVPFEKPGEK